MAGYSVSAAYVAHVIRAKPDEARCVVVNQVHAVIPRLHDRANIEQI